VGQAVSPVARQSVPPPLPPIKYAAAAAAAVAQPQSAGVSAGPGGSLAVGGSSAFSETLLLATSPLSTDAEGVANTHTNVMSAGSNSDSASADGLQYTESSMLTSPKVSQFLHQKTLDDTTDSGK